MNIWIERGVFVTISVFVCFLFLELGVRVLVAQQQAGVMCIYEADAVRGWRLQPNLNTSTVAPSGEYSHLIQTNFRGERGPDTELAGEAFLILGIGDSMAFGQGVEEPESYLRLLEDGLKEEGRNAVVLNAGVGGYNTKQAIDTLELYLDDFNVSLAVLGFFNGNDVYGNLEDSLRYDVVEGCIKPKPVDGIGIKHFLRINFKSYGFFAERLRTVPIVSDFFIGAGLMSERRPNPYMLSMEVGGIQSSWEATEKQFERLQTVAEEHGIEIIALSIPSTFQVNDVLAQEALATYGVQKEGFEFDYPERRLASFVEGKPNLVLVTLVEEFRQSDGGLFYERDPHLTREGHEFVANILLKELLEEVEKK